MITITFHKTLRKYTNNEKSLQVHAGSYIEAIHAAIYQFPKLEYFFKKLYLLKHEIHLIVQKKILSVEEYFFPARHDITLVPYIVGSGKALQIVAAIAIVVIAVMTGQVYLTYAAGSVGSIGAAGAGTAAFGAATGIGATALGQAALGIAGSLFLSALQPTPKLQSRQSTGTTVTAQNDAFESLVNTTDSRNVIPLNYGLMRVGGQFISGYVKTLDRGKDDNILVSEQF